METQCGILMQSTILRDVHPHRRTTLLDVHDPTVGISSMYSQRVALIEIDGSSHTHDCSGALAMVLTAGAGAVFGAAG
jgi:hypothetical protein